MPPLLRDACQPVAANPAAPQSDMRGGEQDYAEPRLHPAAYTRAGDGGTRDKRTPSHTHKEDGLVQDSEDMESKTLENAS